MVDITDVLAAGHIAEHREGLVSFYRLTDEGRTWLAAQAS